MSKPIISSFSFENKELPVTFIETTKVKEGVSCDIYSINNDSTKDLAIIHIEPGFRSPKQRILKGTLTIQRFISGTAYIYITHANNEESTNFFDSKNATQNNNIEVKIGEIMEWSSLGPDPLIYYEICEPPYEEGRFSNLSE